MHEVRNILFFTVEFSLAGTGGLAVVSEGIPRALNRYRDKDARVVVPFYACLRGDPGWTLVDEPISVSQPGGPAVSFRVHQTTHPALGSLVYALECEAIRSLDDLYPAFVSGGTQFHPRTAVPRAMHSVSPSFRNVMLFNRAALELARRLDGGKLATQSGGRGLARFEGRVDAWILNDWMTASIAALAPEERVGKVFILHNVFDHPQLDPTEQTDLPLDCRASPLNALRYADVLIADRNFYETLTTTRLLRSLGVEHVREALQTKRAVCYGMHHGLDRLFDPFDETTLGTHEGFAPLESDGWKLPPEPEDFLHYRRKNKVALQRMLGLEEEPSAILYCWTNRFDRVQKGMDLILDEFPRFQERDSRVQIALLGRAPAGDPRIARFLERMTKRFPGRFCSTLLPYELQPLVNAGSDFSLMPSLYEPFGLAHLQSMSMGCIPVVHGVDGLRSTIVDPSQEPRRSREKTWNGGQTAIEIDPIPVVDYLDAVRRLQFMESCLESPLNAEEEHQILAPHRNLLAAWRQAHESMAAGLVRSLRLAQNPADFVTVAGNGMRYVRQRHSWRALASRYEPALQRAAEEMRRRCDTHSPRSGAASM